MLLRTLAACEVHLRVLLAGCRIDALHCAITVLRVQPIVRIRARALRGEDADTAETAASFGLFVAGPHFGQNLLAGSHASRAEHGPLLGPATPYESYVSYVNTYVNYVNTYVNYGKSGQRAYKKSKRDFSDCRILGSSPQ